MTAASLGMPAQKRGRSFQAYGTPWPFIRAVEARFGPLAVDLAASASNAKAPLFVTKERDTLSLDWATTFPTGNAWLNPEFADIGPYAEKCAAESQRRHGLILFLTPASIGTDWFADHVNRKAMVLGLSPRLAFDGMPVNPKTGKVDGYPKDLCLSVFGFGLSGFDCWRWRR